MGNSKLFRMKLDFKKIIIQKFPLFWPAFHSDSFSDYMLNSKNNKALLFVAWFFWLFEVSINKIWMMMKLFNSIRTWGPDQNSRTGRGEFLPPVIKSYFPGYLIPIDHLWVREWSTSAILFPTERYFWSHANRNLENQFMGDGKKCKIEKS